MEEKISFSKRVVRTVTILTWLFLIPLFGNIPGANVLAAQAAIDNPTYTLTSTDDSAVSTKARPNETTVLIFGSIECSKTNATLDSISSCNWVKRSDIRVIFVDVGLYTKEEIQEFKDGYQCPDLTFCYAEDQTNLKVVYQYKQLLGSDTKSPMIILIDKDNKIQNFSTGTAKTANEILASIKEFANIDEAEDSQPPSDLNTGTTNFPYVLKDIENKNVYVKTNPNEATILLFGDTACGKTKATLQAIDQSDWVSRSDLRIIFADVMGASVSDTTKFANNFSSKDIIFCHDESALNWSHALSYLDLIHTTGGEFPYIIFIDKNNKIQSITLGPKTAEEILTEINKLPANPSPDSTPDTDTKPTTPTPDTKPTTPTPDTEPTTPTPDTKPTTPTPDTDTKPTVPTPGTDTKPTTPTPTASISNVSRLKSSSATKSVKLSWKKIPQAKGYIIYQYNSSKKTWVKKKTLTKNTASYTVKNLTPGTSYRFAVKAYIQSNGKQVRSKSYTALYTATKPGAVSFQVTAGKKKATIKWKKVKGATNYTVYYKTSAKGAWKKLKTVKGTSYTKTKLTSRKTYTFTVKANKAYKGKTYTGSSSSKKVKIK